MAQHKKKATVCATVASRAFFTWGPSGHRSLLCHSYPVQSAKKKESECACHNQILLVQCVPHSKAPLGFVKQEKGERYANQPIIYSLLEMRPHNTQLFARPTLRNLRSTSSPLQYVHQWHHQPISKKRLVYELPWPWASSFCNVSTTRDNMGRF